MDKEALINGYFEGSLSKSEMEVFNQLLKTDPEFVADLEFEKTLQSALKKEERQEIKAVFSEEKTGQEPFKTSERKVIALRPWLIAASVALIAGLMSWLLFFNRADRNTQQLYTIHFAPYENVVHPIERGEEIEDLQDRAFTAYEEGNYEQALALFEELIESKTDSYIDFYRAIVYMQLNEHKAAVPLLENYINNNGQLKDRATWYLALAHLKLNDIDPAKTQLKQLVELGSFKKQEAQQLLGELEVVRRSFPYIN